MSTPFSLEKKMTGSQKAAYAAAMEKRYSCRSYKDGVSAADWAQLSYLAEKASGNGARLQLLRVDEGIFTGTALLVGKITGCTTVAAVIGLEKDLPSRISAGFLGELLVLEAAAMGLGTCWVAGTYKRRNVEALLTLKPGEKLLSIIAIGQPLKEKNNVEFHRKSLERITDGSPNHWPEEVRKAAEAVRIAPSAINFQPWSLSWKNDSLHLHVPDRFALDAGIAICHAEVMLCFPHTWKIGGPGEPTAWTEEKA